MKKIKFLMAIALFLPFVSCSEEEDDIATNKDIAGYWYFEDGNEEVHYMESGTFYERACTPQYSSEVVNGTWSYDKANRKLTTYLNGLGDDYSVIHVSELELKYGNQLLTVLLRKIVESYTLNVGGRASIQYFIKHPGYTVYSYESKNERIATVDYRGQITAAGEKGTTYIKAETNEGAVWVRVTVGNDCMDPWYDYPGLIGKDYTAMKTILGNPDVQDADGTTSKYSYILQYHTYVQNVHVFIDGDTPLIKAIAIYVPQMTTNEVMAYLENHYYRNDSPYYTTGRDLESSVAAVGYDRDGKFVWFYDPSVIFETSSAGLCDYESTFGYTAEQIVSRFGRSLYDGMYYYILDESDNRYCGTIYFYLDETTNTVKAFSLTVRDGIEESEIVRLLSEKYPVHKINDSGLIHGFWDEEANPTIQVIYDTENKAVTYYYLPLWS